MIGRLFAWLGRFLGGGVIERALDTVDRRIAADTDREAIKGEIIKEHLRTRADWMKAGGFWLMLIFAVPLGVYWASVILYSMVWCQKCYWPQDWIIAALPPPFDEWAGAIIISIFGVIGVGSLRR